MRCTSMRRAVRWRFTMRRGVTRVGSSRQSPSISAVRSCIGEPRPACGGGGPLLFLPRAQGARGRGRVIEEGELFDCVWWPCVSSRLPRCPLLCPFLRPRLVPPSCTHVPSVDASLALRVSHGQRRPQPRKCIQPGLHVPPPCMPPCALRRPPHVRTLPRSGIYGASANIARPLDSPRRPRLPVRSRQDACAICVSTSVAGALGRPSQCSTKPPPSATALSRPRSVLTSSTSPVLLAHAPPSQRYSNP
ncbi:hypothetical protein OH76DRAFT_431424 [Lentinus brumalis]|uniref:Uncharacterized protein n=1 Tax=Lentinus brumalis TaxID=2498619 RepID=A0A371DDN6_9APHY|nr:hypothetical protein OH76DRAFT_431424 [Polyporus brumalis]